jgi:hypothetical protein
MGIAMVVVASVASIAHAVPSKHRDSHHRPVADHGGRATPLPASNPTDVPVTPGGPAEVAEVLPLFPATGAPSLLEQRDHDFAELHEGLWGEPFGGTDAGTHGGAPGFLMYHELLALDGVRLRAPSRRDLFAPDGSPRLGMFTLGRAVGMTIPGRMTRGRWYEPGARDRVLGRPAGR